MENWFLHKWNTRWVKHILNKNSYNKAQFCFCICDYNEKRHQNTVGPRVEKFNIVSNNHGLTQKCNFSLLDWENLFWGNLVQIIKLVRLSLSLVLRLIEICSLQWWCWLFSIFDQKYAFRANVPPKNQHC